MRCSTRSKRLLKLIAIAVVAAALVAVPAASARLLPGSAGSLRMQSDATQYTLTVTTSFVGGIGIAPAGGTVSSSPAGINCGNACSAAFPAGTRVNLAATPAAGAAGFLEGPRLSSSCKDTRRCGVTLNRDTTVTAYFVPANAPFLDVTFDGSGSGTVTSSPAGIDCGTGGICGVYVAPGTQVTLTEKADPGSPFSGWSAPYWSGQVLDCSGAGTTMSTCTVTVTEDTLVNATFGTPLRTLNVTLRGAGWGTVTSSPAGIDCPATCSDGFPAGTQVTLTATAKPGSTFSGWGGQECAGTSTCVVTLNGEPAVQAFFRINSPPPKACVVPNVKGETLSAAKKKIKRHHCGVGKTTMVTSSPKNKGRVISQNPRAGKHLNNGADVALKLGK